MNLTSSQREAVDRAADILERRGYEAFIAWVSSNLAAAAERTASKGETP